LQSAKIYNLINSEGKMSSKETGKFWYFSAYFLLALIVFLSLTSSLKQYFPRSIINLLGNGNNAHFVSYFSLMYFFSKAYFHRIDPRKIGLVLIIIGVSMELLQGFRGSPREFSLSDILSNSLGIILGFFVISYKNKFSSFRIKRLTK
jgi:hypothetical protein